MNKYTIIASLILLYVLALGFYWMPIGGKLNLEIRDILYLLTPFSGVVAGIYALRMFGFHGTRSRTLLLLTFGMGYWLVGELLWDYYLYFLHTNPFPSIADGFYLLAYPLIFFGLINEIFAGRIEWKRLNKAILFLLFVASLAIGALVLYFGVFQAYDPHETLLTNAIAIGYGIGDLFLILANMLIIVLALDVKGGKLSRTWFCLFLSFIFTLIADILFATHNSQYKADIGFYKNFLDSLWMAGYILFAYSLFSLGFSIREAHLMIEKLQKERK